MGGARGAGSGDNEQAGGFRMIRVFAGSRIVQVLELVCISLMQAALAVAVAYCVQQVFDRMLASRADIDPYFAAAITTLLVGSLVAIAILEVRRLTTAERLSLGYIATLRTAMFTRIMNAAPSVIHRRRESGLLLPFLGDLTAIKKWVGDGLVRAISATVTLTLLLSALYLLSQALAIGAAIVVGTAIFVAFLFSGPLMRAIRRVRNRRGAIANFVSSSTRAAATVQAFSRMSRELQRLERRTEALTLASVRLARWSGIMSALALAAGGALVVLTLAAGVFGNEPLTAGVLAAAISLVGLASTAVRDLGIAFESGKRAQASFAKVKAALAIAPSVKSVHRARDFAVSDGVIAFENVSVDGVLERISLSAKPGDVINIEGASGAGKSLLAALIVRLRDPDHGVVSFDGRDLRRVPTRALRRNVGFAAVAAPLMRGSVWMNLKYRAPRASGDELARVVDLCGLQSVIDNLPGGEQAKLSEGAPELSRSDQQRLMIARAMLGGPPLLVLDEVDSHLDEETAERLAASFADYPGVLILAASSQAWRRAATTIWSIADKRVIAKPAAGLAGIDGGLVTLARSAS